jgi:hypothetical protein
VGAPTPGSPELNCEAPFGEGRRFAHNELFVRGWAQSPAGVVEVRVKIDGATRPASFQGSSRVRFEALIDTSDWEAGTRPLAVTAVDAEGREAIERGSVDVVPYSGPVGQREAAAGRGAALACSLPREGLMPALPLRSRGWAYASSGIERVVLFLDGHSHHEAHYGLTRPEIQRALGRPDALASGYALTLDPRDLGAGPHVLTVVAFPRDGARVGVTRSFVTVAGTKLAGEQAEPTAPADPPPRPRAHPGAESTGTSDGWKDRALRSEAEAALALAQRIQAQKGEERALMLLGRVEQRRREAERALEERRWKRRPRWLAG